MPTYIDRVVEEKDGKTIGRITDVIGDQATLEPEFVIVRAGRFKREHLLPVAVLRNESDHIVLTCSGELAKGAPRPKNHTSPNAAEREAVRKHFGLSAPERRGREATRDGASA